jgi:cytochrome c biogenesis protein CcmG/thiol:disulfide interchange protein DsbE
MTESAAAVPRSAFTRFRWLVEIGAVVGLYFAVSAYQGRHLLGTGTQAPAFTLTSLDGSTVSLESLRGKRTLVHFWATWCGVCRQEFGALNAVSAGLGEDEALVTIVADSDDPEAVRRFVREHALRYPVLLASDDIVRAYKVGAFPTNYYVAPDGKITTRTVGMSSRFTFNTRLALAR